MIEFDNKGKVIKVEYDQEQEGYTLKLAKKLTLKPLERFVIKTKMTVKCTHQLDECVIIDYLDDDLEAYILADKYSDNGPDEEVELVGFYAGKEPLTLPAGTTLALAMCYHKCREEDHTYLMEDERDKPVIFLNDNIRVQSLKPEYSEVQTVLEPDGTTYIKIPLERATNE